MNQVLGKCGNVCSSCPWSQYIRAKIEPDKWTNYTREVKKYTGYSPTQNPCQGCQTPNERLAKTVGVHRAVVACSARSCALDTGVVNCAYCSRYACDKILLMNSMNTRECAEKRLGEPISDQAYDSYIRIFRGMERIDQIHSSLGPEDLIAPRRVDDETVQIVDFPDDMSLPGAEVLSYRRLHSKLSSLAISKFGFKDSDTIACHQLLVDRRGLVFGLLWMIGLQGRPGDDDSSLLVDSFDVAAVKKKIKGMPHSEEAWQRVFRLLEATGVKCEFIALADNRTTPSGWLREKAPGSDKPAWSIRATFSTDWGGPKAAMTLQLYIRYLAGRYGRNAYTRFARVDMRGLNR